MILTLIIVAVAACLSILAVVPWFRVRPAPLGSVSRQWLVEHRSLKL
jgi:hypothetical protein